MYVHVSLYESIIRDREIHTSIQKTKRGVNGASYSNLYKEKVLVRNGEIKAYRRNNKLNSLKWVPKTFVGFLSTS